jgi:aryl-alcohol dehydrogenase-like predicted oxidoreductase
MGDGPNDAGTSRLAILREVDASLRRLDTGWIDLYYLHSPDYTTPLEESLEALNDCVRAGKVRYIACSNFYAWQVCEGLWWSDRRRWAAFAGVQPLYNLVNRDAEVELLPFCQKHGLGVVPYSPLARGVLSGKYRPSAQAPEGSRAARGDRRIQQTELREESFQVAQALLPLAEARGKSLTQWALAWVLGNPIVTSAIIGPRTLDQLEDNLGALGWRLTAEEEAAVDRLVPPGEHTGKGYNDPSYPVRGRSAS